MSYSKTTWQNLPNTTTPVNATRMNNIENGIANADGAIGVNAYSNSATYAIGDYCIYNNKLYKCKVAITAGETFTSSKWEQTNIIDEIETVEDKSALTVSGEGDNIILNGTSKNAFKKFVVKGNTYQEANPTTANPKTIHSVTGTINIDILSKNDEEQNLPLTLGDIELCELGTARDYFYHKNNKWYLHKETEKITLKGTETYVKNTEYTNSYSFIMNLYRTRTSKASPTNILCNMLKAETNNDANTIRIVTGNGNMVLNFAKDFVSYSTSAVVDKITQLYNNGTPIIVIIPLATPTDTEITNATLKSQLDAIANAVSYDEQTIISNTSSDLPANVEAIAYKNISSDNYVTQEIPIGTWLGKPSYRKVIDFGALPNTTYKSVNHNISNIDTIIDFKVVAKYTGNGTSYPIPFSSADATNNIALTANNTTVTITTGSNRSAITQCYVTLEYTKTTD